MWFTPVYSYTSSPWSTQLFRSKATISSRKNKFLDVAVALGNPKIHTEIANTGASHLYIATQAPHGPPNSSAPKLLVGKTNGQLVFPTATETLPIPQRGNGIPC